MCCFIRVLELFCSCAGTFYFLSKFEIHHFYFVCLLLFSGIGCLHEKVRGAKAPKCKSTKIDIFCKNIELYQELQALTRKSTIGLYLHLHSICTHTQNYTLKCIYSLSANIIYFCTCEHNWECECKLSESKNRVQFALFMSIANIRLNSIFFTKNQFWCFCTLVPWHL